MCITHSDPSCHPEHPEPACQVRPCRAAVSTHPPQLRVRRHVSLNLKSCRLSSCSQAHLTDSRGTCDVSVAVRQNSNHGHLCGLLWPRHWPRGLPSQTGIGSSAVKGGTGGSEGLTCAARLGPALALRSQHRGPFLEDRQRLQAKPTKGRSLEDRGHTQSPLGRQTWKGHQATSAPPNGEAQRRRVAGLGTR